MKIIKLSCTVFIATIFALACHNTSTDQVSNTHTERSPQLSPVFANRPGDEFAFARDIFGHVCARCHGSNAEGGKFEMEGVTLNVPSLKAEHARKLSDQEIARQITNGGGGMPSFKDRLKPEQIDELVRFIRKELQGGNSTK